MVTKKANITIKPQTEGLNMLKNMFFVIACLSALSGVTAQAWHEHRYEPAYESDYYYDEGYRPGIVGGAVSEAGRAVEDAGSIIGNFI